MPTDDRFVGRRILTTYQTAVPQLYYDPGVGGTVLGYFSPGGCYFHSCIPHPRQTGYFRTSEGPIILTHSVSQPLYDGYELVGLAECSLPEANGQLVGLLKGVQFWGDPDHTPQRWSLLLQTANAVSAGDNSFSYLYSCWLDDMGNPPTPPANRFALSATKIMVFNYPVASVADVQLTNSAGNTIIELPAYFDIVHDTPVLWFETEGLVDAAIADKYGVCVFCLHGLNDLNIRRFTVSYGSSPNQFLPILPNTNRTDGGLPANDYGGGSYGVVGVKDVLSCILVYSTPTYNIYLTKQCVVLGSSSTDPNVGVDSYSFVCDATTNMVEVL